MYNNPKQASGFTLLELMVTVAIAAILIGVAIPSFKDMIRNSRLTTYANEFVASLNLARSEAVKRGTSVTAGKISTTGNWGSSGWRVFVDVNGNGTLDSGGEDANSNGVLDAGEDSNGNGMLDGDYLLRTYPALPTYFSLIGNGAVLVNRITYLADGSDNSTAGSLALCDNSDGNTTAEAYTARLIIISNMGRVQMGKDRDGDGRPEKNDGTTLTDCTAP